MCPYPGQHEESGGQVVQIIFWAAHAGSLGCVRKHVDL